MNNNIQYIINEDNCVVIRFPNVIYNSNSVYNYLVHNIPWMVDLKQVVYGKECNIPRSMFFLGDDEVKTYKYSRLEFPVVPWSSPAGDFSIVSYIRDHVRSLLSERGMEIEFNSCLLNHYKNGSDYIAYHSDKEVSAPYYAVATVSLGSNRRFILKRVTDAPKECKIQKGEKVDITLSCGDVVVMVGDTQKKFHHSIPVEKKVKEGRISLTYRLIH